MKNNFHFFWLVISNKRINEQKVFIKAEGKRHYYHNCTQYKFSIDLIPFFNRV